MNVQNLKNRIKKLEMKTPGILDPFGVYQNKTSEELDAEIIALNEQIKELDEKYPNRIKTPEVIKLDKEIKELDEKFQRMRKKIAEEKESSRSG